jgi:glycosyltransferase involved in cell wall biosynthesis
VINAFGELVAATPSASLTIVGTGEFEPQLRELAKTLGVADKVHFLGHIEDREKLNYYYRTHDIFCLTSVSEGSPRVIIEAMANGTNVICTPTGSLPFVFKHGEELLFVDFNSVADLKAKITYLLKDNAESGRIRANAYRKAKDLDMINFLDSVFK